MKTIMTVVGARPQFVKAAVLSRFLADHDCGLREILVHTGQHYDQSMSQSFFDELSIPQPDVNLGIQSGGHGAMTGRMLEQLEAVMQDKQPDMVVVYGDTNSTLAGALAAAKLHVPVAHVEAGLRSFNRAMPEEINRVLTDHVSDLLFCSSDQGVRWLADEGVREGVYGVGDIMIDAIAFYQGQARMPERDGDFALATIHRAENVDDTEKLAAILAGLGACPLPVILPLHPRTRKAVESAGLVIPDTVEVIEPLSYLSMLGYVKRSAFVLTDSGGLQKEACFLKKPCVILRNETEWVELTAQDMAYLAGPDRDKIADSYAWASAKTIEDGSPYGDGHSAERITGHIRTWLDQKG